jgi:hypothetical protein
MAAHGDDLPDRRGGYEGKLWSDRAFGNVSSGRA